MMVSREWWFLWRHGYNFGTISLGAPEYKVGFRPFFLLPYRFRRRVRSPSGSKAHNRLAVFAGWFRTFWTSVYRLSKLTLSPRGIRVRPLTVMKFSNALPLAGWALFRVAVSVYLYPKWVFFCFYCFLLFMGFYEFIRVYVACWALGLRLWLPVVVPWPSWLRTRQVSRLPALLLASRKQSTG